MNNIINTATNNILIKDLSDLIDFSKIEKRFGELTWSKNTLNKISVDMDFFERSELDEIKQTLIKECIQFLRNGHQLDQGFEGLKMTQSWGNITSPGEAHHEHAHPFSIISGVIFLDDNPANINLALKSLQPTIPYFLYLKDIFVPLGGFLNGSPPGNLKNHLVLFLSTTEHKVIENKEGPDRRSIAFNTFWDGKVGNGHPLASIDFKSVNSL
jgi:hypothetical protein